MTKAYWGGHVAEMGERLRAAREKHGVSGAGAARLIGMTPSRLSALEGGRIEAKAIDVALIARLTGADPIELLMGDDREPIEVPDDPAYYRRPQGEATRTANRKKRQAENVQEFRRRPGPAWRPAGIGRDVRPQVGGEGQT